MSTPFQVDLKNKVVAITGAGGITTVYADDGGIVVAY